MRHLARLAVVAVAAGTGLPGLAAEPTPPPNNGLAWHFNGYGTLGLAHVETSEPGWGFVRDLSQPAQSGSPKSWLDSRLGLQLNWLPHPQLELVAQGVLRKQDPQAKTSQHLDWAFAAWRPHADWALRVGRISPDVFLLADYRNVGFAFPWARPNVELYGFIAFQSMDGLDLAYRWQTGDTDWKLKASFGSHTTTQASSGTLPDGSPTPPARIRSKDFLVATLSRERLGLTWKLTYAQAQTEVGNQALLLPVVGGLNQLAAAGVPGVSAEAAVLAQSLDLANVATRYLAVGVDWQHDDWQLMAELNKVGGGVRDVNGLRGYVSLARRFGAVTPFVMLGRARPDHGGYGVPTHWAATLAPILGQQAAAEAVQLGAAAASVANRTRSDQHSVSLGLRWDLMARTALKLQADHIRVAPGGTGLWHGSDGFSGGRGTVVSATVDFVF